MEQVLQDLNLKAYTKTFFDEKITPDIVCKLSSHEMEALGVSSRADMMRLRTECVKYGTDKPQRALFFHQLFFKILRFKFCNSCSMVESQLHAYIRVHVQSFGVFRVTSVFQFSCVYLLIVHSFPLFRKQCYSNQQKELCYV